MALQRIPAFPLTSSQLAKYDLKYVGKERVDEIDCFIFQAKPRMVERIKAYSTGFVWVDAKYLEVVKTYGKWVTDQGEMNEVKDLPFALFETYRENVDGKYWFPNYSRSDGTVNLKGLEIPMRCHQVDGLQTHCQRAASACSAASRKFAETNKRIFKRIGLQRNNFFSTSGNSSSEPIRNSGRCRAQALFPWGKGRGRQWRGHPRVGPSPHPEAHRLRTRMLMDAAPSGARPGAALWMRFLTHGVSAANARGEKSRQTKFAQLTADADANRLVDQAKRISRAQSRQYAAGAPR